MVQRTFWQIILNEDDEQTSRKRLDTPSTSSERKFWRSLKNILRRDNDSDPCVRTCVDENKNNNDVNDEDEETTQNNSESSDEWEYL